MQDTFKKSIVWVLLISLMTTGCTTTDRNVKSLTPGIATKEDVLRSLGKPEHTFHGDQPAGVTDMWEYMLMPYPGKVKYALHILEQALFIVCTFGIIFLTNEMNTDKELYKFYFKDDLLVDFKDPASMKVKPTPAEEKKPSQGKKSHHKR